MAVNFSDFKKHLNFNNFIKPTQTQGGSASASPNVSTQAKPDKPTQGMFAKFWSSFDPTSISNSFTKYCLNPKFNQPMQDLIDELNRYSAECAEIMERLLREANSQGSQSGFYSAGFGGAHSAGFGFPHRAGFGGAHSAGFGFPHSAGFGAAHTAGFGFPRATPDGSSQQGAYASAPPTGSKPPEPRASTQFIPNLNVASINSRSDAVKLVQELQTHFGGGEESLRALAKDIRQAILHGAMSDRDEFNSKYGNVLGDISDPALRKGFARLLTELEKLAK